MISAEYTITDLNQLIYNFAFDYLKKKYVKVSSKNTTTGVVTNCTYGVHYVVVDKTIELLQSVGAVGDVLRIVRETSTSEQIVSWNDASILKASDMSLAQLQQLHILEEYSEYMSTSSVSLDINGQYDAKNSRIVNLLAPQTATDAVNRGYIDSFIGTLTDAQTSATLAQSWAVGDILSRPEGSSKYWAEQANIITNGDLWLKKDGSRPLDPTYSPTTPQDIATKDYVDSHLNTSEVLDYNGIDTKTQRDRNIEFDASRYTGIENNIISGRKVSGVSNFTLGLTAGANWINSRRYDRLANDITLSPRSVNLVYDKNDGTTGSVPAKYPTDMIDNNTVGFWIFNKTTAGANIPNSAVGVSSIAVANDLVPSGGITSVDGWCDYASKLDGTSGYYVSQNSTGIPIGANVREFSIMFTLNAINNTNNHLLNMGSASGTAGFELFYQSTGVLFVNNGGTDYSTGFTVEVGKTYKVTSKITGTTISVFINGVLIYTGAFVVNTTATNLSVGRYITGSYFWGATLHYLEVRNALRTDEQTAQIANKLLLPCFYTGVDGKRKNITEILPTNSVSLGMVKANSTGITAYNDTDYMYGRREGAYGGNRRVFLGRKAFSGATNLTWGNPFGTRKVKLQAVWSQDANGRNECDVIPAFNTTVEYGVYIGSYSISPSNRIIIATRVGGVCNFNGAWQTSGYIGVYAEVLE